MKYASLSNKKMIIVGFGSIGPAILPLILKHIEIKPEQIEIIAADTLHEFIAKKYSITFTHLTLTEENYKAILTPRLQEGNILLNLSLGVSCLDLIALCQVHGTMYLDTSSELWLTADSTTFFRREELMKNKCSGSATALICSGANPGLVSHFAKQAVLDVAEKILPRGRYEELRHANQWGALCEESGIVVMHIAERDTQLGARGRRANEYVNTWSVEGFLQEAEECAGFAWGSHEKELGDHLIRTCKTTETCRMIELDRSGGELQVQSWVPSHGKFRGFLIPHPEAFSLAEFFSNKSNGHLYHPTVHFVYQPCNDAVMSMHDAAARAWPREKEVRLLIDDIIEGMDELGILILRKDSSEVYWYGSQLTVEEARQLVPHNNATSLQVAAGVLSGLVWMLEHPKEGIVEAEQMDFEKALAIAKPYLGQLKGHWGVLPTTQLSRQFDELAVNFA